MDISLQEAICYDGCFLSGRPERTPHGVGEGGETLWVWEMLSGISLGTLFCG